MEDRFRAFGKEIRRAAQEGEGRGSREVIVTMLGRKKHGITLTPCTKTQSIATHSIAVLVRCRHFFLLDTSVYACMLFNFKRLRPESITRKNNSSTLVLARRCLCGIGKRENGLEFSDWPTSSFFPRWNSAGLPVLVSFFLSCGNS